MLKQFKEFAFKGNLVDMAVGFILGGAFATVVKSLVANVIMPPLGWALGGVDFTKLQYTIKEASVKDGKEIEAVTIKYGQFITDAISFILLAFVIFIIVKKFIAAFEKQKEEKPAETPKQEVLLEQILEQLKK